MDKCLTLTLATMALAASAPSHAGKAVAGKVLTTTGDTRAISEDGNRRDLDRGGNIVEGDVVVTGSEGNLQVRMNDGGIVSVTPESRFLVKKYRKEGEDPGASMKLIEGGIRTVTGTIKGEDKDYNMEAGAASIGVRGTAYSLRRCDSGCPGEAEGLYGAVRKGTVMVGIGSTQTEFSEGSYFHAARGEAAPEEIIEPPSGILEGQRPAAPPASGEGGYFPGEEIGSASSDGDANGGHATGGGGNAATPDARKSSQDRDEADFVQGEYIDENGNPKGLGEDAQFAGLVAGAFVADAGTSGSSDPDKIGGGVINTTETGEVWVDSRSKVYLIRPDDTLSNEAIWFDDMSLAESDEVTDLDISWGRWTGDYKVSRDDWDEDLEGQGSFFYATTTNFTTAAELDALTGKGTYKYSGEGPSLVDAQGGDWSIDAFNFEVDFDTGAVSNAKLDMSKAGTGYKVVMSQQNTETSLGADGTAATVFVINSMDGILMKNSQKYGDAVGRIEGGLVGPDASGALAELGVNVDDLAGDDFADIRGIKILRLQ